MVHDISDLVALAAQEVPERRAVVESGGRSITWLDLEAEVAAIAAGLAGVGIRAGQRVLIAMGNRLEFVSTYLGVLRAQVVAVPVNPVATPEALARQIADSGSRLVVADPLSLPAVRAAVALLVRAIEGDDFGLGEELLARVSRPIVVVVEADPEPGEITFADLHAHHPDPVPPLQDPEKLAALLFTTDGEGRSRAAMLTHRALLANLDQVAAISPPMMHGDDVVLGVLPLFHIYGLNAVLGAVLRSRARLVLAEFWDPQAALDLIEDEACSVLPLAPPVFAHWLGDPHLRDRLGPVRLVVSGSAALSAEIIDAFREATGLEVQQGFGLTEASPVVTSTLASEHPYRGSVGAPLSGVEVRLVDDACAVTNGEDPAHIQIRGANLFSGYWPDGADGPSPATDADGGGWWSTGDVGIFAEGGDLMLLDRAEEVVVVSGFSVYPSEVEQVLREVPGVEAVAVLGADHEATGQEVVAYLQAPGVDVAAVAEAAAAVATERLAAYKRPTRVEIVDELPRSLSGRVSKRELRGAQRRRVLGLLT